MDNLNEMIRVVAEYDQLPMCSAPAHKDSPRYRNGKIYVKVDELTYHTSFDALIPVAKKACEELDNLSIQIEREITNLPFSDNDGSYKLEQKLNKVHTIHAGILRSLGEFEVMSIFTATYNAIQLINQYKNKDNE